MSEGGRAGPADDGGYVEGCGLRIWTEFPLAEIADILSRKEVTQLVLRDKISMYIKPFVV